MDTNKRITVRATRTGFMVCSGRGIFGTHITVKHRATADAIKHVMKLLTYPCPLRNDLIDGLMRAESVITPSEMPSLQGLLDRKEAELRARA